MFFIETLLITNINNYEFTLKGKNKEYKIVLELHDLEVYPEVNDFIIINESLLSEQFLSFGSLGNAYGRKLNDPKDPDIIVLNINNNNVYLKRLYG